MNWFRWHDGDLILNIKIQANASRSEFAGIYGEFLRVRIHAPAVEGRANDELLAFICQRFATAKSRISIERGLLSRMKSLRIQVPSQLPAELMSLGLIASAQRGSQN
jgi:uncharacterized protein (TIGR00251 family)